jgi:hypothetical protein
VKRDASDAGARVYFVLVEAPRHRSARVPPFRDLLDQLPVERGKVVRLAAGHEAVVHDDLLIDPGLRPRS